MQCPFLFFDSSPPRLVPLRLILQRRMGCSPRPRASQNQWSMLAGCHNQRHGVLSNFLNQSQLGKLRLLSFGLSQKEIPTKFSGLRERVGCACAAFFSNSISCAARSTRRLSYAHLLHVMQQGDCRGSASAFSS